MSAFASSHSPRRLRVCLVGQPSGHVLERARIVLELGHEMVIVAGSPVDLGPVSVLIPESGAAGRLLGGKLAAGVQFFSLLSCLRNVEADVFHVHYCHGDLAWALLVSGRAPVLATVMGGDLFSDEQADSGWAARRLTRALLRSAERVTAKSAFLRDGLVSAGVAADRIADLNWGVELRRAYVPRDRVRERLDIPTEAPVIVVPRALQPLYNAELAVEAFARVATRIPEARIVIPTFQADADYEMRVRQKAAALGLSTHVLFIPPAAPSEMRDLMAAADIVLQIPSSDGLPQSLIEAMAAGTCNVVHDLQCYDGVVIDGVTGVRVPLDAEAIASALTRLLTDVSERTRLASAAGDMARALFDREGQLAILDGLYLSLADGPRRRRSFVFRATALALVLVDILGRYAAIRRMSKAIFGRRKRIAARSS